MAEAKPVEVLPSRVHIERLYWLSSKTPPRNVPNTLYFNLDNVALGRSSHTLHSRTTSARSTLQWPVASAPSWSAS